MSAKADGIKFGMDIMAIGFGGSGIYQSANLDANYLNL